MPLQYSRFRAGGRRPKTVGFATPQTSGFAPLLRGIQNLDDRDSGATAANLQYFDYIHTFSGRLFPTAGTRSTYKTLITATKALNSGSKFYGYCIWFEKGTTASKPVGTYSRSGSTLTLNTVSVTDDLAAAAPSSSTNSGTVLVLGFTGADAVYNGEWVSLGNGATSVSMTVSGSALTGPTSGTGAGNVMVVPKATVDYYYYNKLKDNPTWWQYKRGKSGHRAAWNVVNYGAWNMDITNACTPDGSGMRWREWNWDFHLTNMAKLSGTLIGLDGIFIDNYMDPRQDLANDTGYGSSALARATIDVTNDGIGQDIRVTSGAAVTSMRTGHAATAALVQADGFRAMGNHDNANSSTLAGAFSGSLDEVFYENVFNLFTDAGRVGTGASALGGSNGFSKYFSPSGAVGSIQAAVGKLRTGGKVILGTEYATTADREVARFVIGMAWLHDIAVPMLAPQDSVAKNGGVALEVPDEFKIGLGSAVDSIPTVPSVVSSGLVGIWARRYQNGIVLVNNHTSALNYDLTGTSYKRINGTTDPTVNSGGAIINALYSVPACSARILVINDPGL